MKREMEEGWRAMTPILFLWLIPWNHSQRMSFGFFCNSISLVGSMSELSLVRIVAIYFSGIWVTKGDTACWSDPFSLFSGGRHCDFRVTNPSQQKHQCSMERAGAE